MAKCQLSHSTPNYISHNQLQAARCTSFYSPAIDSSQDLNSNEFCWISTCISYRLPSNRFIAYNMPGWWLYSHNCCCLSFVFDCMKTGMNPTFFLTYLETYAQQWSFFSSCNCLNFSSYEYKYLYINCYITVKQMLYHDDLVINNILGYVLLR